MRKSNQFNLFKPKRITSVLGLLFDGSRIECVHVRRTNGSLQVVQRLNLPLTLEPLSGDPELVGREIRTQLNSAGIREKNCVVGVPLKWVLAFQTKVPDLPEPDVASFLQIESERNFPCDASTLQTAQSRWTTPAGERYATVMGIPREHVQAIERVLRAGQLKPLSFSISLPALQPPEPERSRDLLALDLSSSEIGLQVSTGGGIASLRTLDAHGESDEASAQPDAGLILRDVRITLGELSGGIGERVRRIRIFGPLEKTQEVAHALEARMEGTGIQVERVISYQPGEFSFQMPVDTPVSPALSLAASFLSRGKSAFEFLPPRVSAWQQLSSRYASGKLKKAGVVAGSVAAIGLILAGYQQVELWQLRKKWAGMENHVKDLETVQQRIRQFRPWFDETHTSLSILRELSVAFPEEGSVWARSIEIRDGGTVTCSGEARDHQALYKTLEKIRTSGVAPDLKVDRIQGKSPLQFTFVFHWAEGGKSAN